MNYSSPQADSDAETSLTIVEAVPPDAGVYECVAKNPAGECRCRSRLNMVLAKTGAEAERGPRQEAPRFADPIKPVVGQEGGNAEFRANYTGEPGAFFGEGQAEKNFFQSQQSVGGATTSR